MGQFFSNLRENPINFWLGVCGILAGVSVPLYLKRPDAAIINFGGTPTPTSRFWIQTVAGGDALIAFLCFEALRSGSPATKQLVAKSIGVYNAFHMGAFINGHLKHEPQPQGLGVSVVSLIIGSAASLYWGFLPAIRGANKAS